MLKLTHPDSLLATKDSNQEPVFYMLNEGIDRNGDSMPSMTPNELKNNPCFLIIPPDRVYRFETIKNKEGKDEVTLIPCENIFSIKRPALQAASDSGGQKQQ